MNSSNGFFKAVSGNLSTLVSMIGLVATIYFSIWYAPRYLSQLEESKTRNVRESVVSIALEFAFDDEAFNIDKLNEIIIGAELDADVVLPEEAEEIINIAKFRVASGSYLPVAERNKLISRLDRILDERQSINTDSTPLIKVNNVPYRIVVDSLASPRLVADTTVTVDDSIGLSLVESQKDESAYAGKSFELIATLLGIIVSVLVTWSFVNKNHQVQEQLAKKAKIESLLGRDGFLEANRKALESSENIEVIGALSQLVYIGQAQDYLRMLNISSSHKNSDVRNAAKFAAKAWRKINLNEDAEEKTDNKV